MKPTGKKAPGGKSPDDGMAPGWNAPGGKSPDDGKSPVWNAPVVVAPYLIVSGNQFVENGS